jgi:hypothetical protein
LNPRLRSLALGTLLLVLPFSGIRVICIEAVPAVSDPAATADGETEAEALTDCERLCPFHPPASVQVLHADAASAPSDEESDCGLSSDAAALQMMGTIAVLRSAPPLTVPYVVADIVAAAAVFYSDPALTHFAPPPRPQAL